MPDQHFRSLDRLIQQANQASARKPGSVEILATMIRLATEDGADPYLVLGVLVEGAVHVLDKHVPAKRRTEATAQFSRLLIERLKARGLA
jgi:6,7-dimethyl-8-ribityllumazine synthase